MGRAGAPLELGKLISYRSETDCGKRPRFFQLKTNATVMFKEDFQETLKFQWIEKGIWIVTTSLKTGPAGEEYITVGKTGRTNSCTAIKRTKQGPRYQG